jgi:hypothetical protein
MVILNRLPTHAVRPIAMVPQKLILMIALKTLEPPVFATTIPNRIKKNRAVT